MISKKKKIFVNRIAPDIQECKLILLYVIAQAVRDYEIYKKKTSEEDREIYLTDEGFIFDDNYSIDWGDEVLTLNNICDLIDIDIDWLRNQVGNKNNLKWMSKQGILLPKERY